MYSLALTCGRPRASTVRSAVAIGRRLREPNRQDGAAAFVAPHDVRDRGGPPHPQLPPRFQQSGAGPSEVCAPAMATRDDGAVQGSQRERDAPDRAELEAE